MATPCDSLAQYIAVDLAVGALGTVVFEDNMPDATDGTLDTCVTIYNTGGQPAALTQSDDTDYPSFQVICRSLDPATAIANDQAIFHGLHGLTETTVHGTHFKLVAAVQSGPTSLGRDEKQRYLYARNYRSMVTGVTR